MWLLKLAKWALDLFSSLFKALKRYRELREEKKGKLSWEAYFETQRQLTSILANVTEKASSDGAILVEALDSGEEVGPLSFLFSQAVCDFVSSEERYSIFAVWSRIPIENALREAFWKASKEEEALLETSDLSRNGKLFSILAVHDIARTFVFPVRISRKKALFLFVIFKEGKTPKPEELRLVASLAKEQIRRLV